MCSRLTRTAVTCICIGASTLAALAQAPVADDQPAPAAHRIDIDAFGRAGAPPAPAQLRNDVCAGFWHNGPLDDVTAHLAQKTPVGDFLVADDFIIKDGFWACIDTITVCFAVSNTIDGVMTKPTFGLTVYNDCDGRPDSVAYQPLPEDITATLIGPAAFAGFNLWSVEFAIDQFIDGYQRPWISPYGVGSQQDALYYWLSANNGLVQGAQAQLKNGAEPWMDAQDCDCPDVCTDMYFLICGRECCLTKDNTPFDALDGAPSLQLKGASIATTRAADNFQIIPDEPVELCAVEAWMATNCPLDKIFLEFYANDCNCPGPQLCTMHSPDFPIVEDTGLVFQGCTIYRLFWKLDGTILQPGQDYWLSVVAEGTGSILDKAYWMYRSAIGPDGAPICSINITEGKVKDVFVPGMEDWIPVSQDLRFNGPHDFAFRLWTNPLPPPPPLLGACCFIGEDVPLCSDLTEEDCSGLGSFYTDPCAALTCPAAQIGACCFLTARSLGVLCDDTLMQFDCDLAGAIFAGADTQCQTNPCAQFFGACCLGAFVCFDSDEDSCAAQSGHFLGLGTECGLATCPAACCFGDASCQDLSAPDCATAGGTHSAASLCASAQCAAVVSGACCFPDGSCQDLIEPDCTAAGGAHFFGIDCAAADCPQPARACCFDDGSCVDFTESDCLAASGIPSPLGDCALTFCPQPSFACCFPDGSCADLTEEDCTNAGGFIDAPNCAIAACPQPTFACCFDDGTCADLTEQDCAAAAGITYLPDDCATASCPQPDYACCFQGSCFETQEQLCLENGGDFFSGSDCTQITCFIPPDEGACCLPIGLDCVFTTESDCTDQGGTWFSLQDCTACAGACCLADDLRGGGSCTEVGGQAECGSIGGTFIRGASCAAGQCAPFIRTEPGGSGPAPARRSDTLAR